MIYLQIIKRRYPCGTYRYRDNGHLTKEWFSMRKRSLPLNELLASNAWLNVQTNKMEEEEEQINWRSKTLSVLIYD